MINPMEPTVCDNTASDIVRLVLDHVRKGLPRNIADGLTMTTPLYDLGFDLILYDELAHNSITQGIRLSGAKHRSFRHNDHEALDRLLGDIRGQHRRAAVVVEGVHSMDGDYPDVPRLMEIKRRHNALLYVQRRIPSAPWARQSAASASILASSLAATSPA